MQTRIDSFMEAATNTAIGLVVSTIANATLTPLVLGHPISLLENVGLSVGFTVISILRSYWLRRLFNGRSVWSAIKEAMPHRCPDCGKFTRFERLVVNWGVCDRCFDESYSEYLERATRCEVSLAAVQRAGVGE